MKAFLVSRIVDDARGAGAPLGWVVTVTERPSKKVCVEVQSTVAHSFRRRHDLAFRPTLQRIGRTYRNLWSFSSIPRPTAIATGSCDLSQQKVATRTPRAVGAARVR